VTRLQEKINLPKFIAHQLNPGPASDIFFRKRKPLVLRVTMVA
jgi:hypothetical protein